MYARGEGFQRAIAKPFGRRPQAAKSSATRRCNLISKTVFRKEVSACGPTRGLCDRPRDPFAYVFYFIRFEKNLFYFVPIRAACPEKIKEVIP
jgi:hypothetical protein